MVNWNCCSALCTNNHCIILSDGSKIKYYRLLRNKEIQRKYSTILKTTGINFKSGYICAQHWIKEYRQSTDNPPDLPVPPSQLSRLKTSIQTPKGRLSRKNRSTLKRKLSAAERLSLPSNSNDHFPEQERQRKSPRARKKIISTPIRKHVVRPKSLSKENYSHVCLLSQSSMMHREKLKN